MLVILGLVAIASGASAYSRVVRLSESAVGKFLLFLNLGTIRLSRE
jgi:hypothetical protein